MDVLMGSTLSLDVDGRPYPGSVASDPVRLNLFTNVWTVLAHRCGASGSMRACHAAGPGLIPGRDRFPG